MAKWAGLATIERGRFNLEIPFGRTKNGALCFGSIAASLDHGKSKEDHAKRGLASRIPIPMSFGCVIVRADR